MDKSNQERDIMRFTTRDAEAVLGRPVTNSEYRRIIKTLEAYMPEVFAEVVLIAVETD